MDQLVECFKCISTFAWLESFLEKNLLEFLDGPIEDSDSDLIWHDLRGELLLKVRMPSLQRLLDDVVFVRLHLCF
jgi:hypothetical protein